MARSTWLGVALAALIAAGDASAQIRNTADFSMTGMSHTDDGSVGPVSTGFTFNLFGLVRNSVYVNNNGNVTFDGALSSYTPFAITGGSIPMLAPYFGDVDTSPSSSGVTTYGTGTVDGHAAFAVDWIDVGYYNGHTGLTNSFQLMLIDRSDIAAGAFDFEFNYGSIGWESGDYSGGFGGFGGSTARVGWTNGAGNYFELAGSGVTHSFTDGDPNALNGTRLNFAVRGGEVSMPSTTTPEPATLALLGTGLAGIALAARRRRSS